MRINPVIRGWMQYYGVFYKTELYPLLYRISAYLSAVDTEEVPAAEGICQERTRRGRESP